MRALLVLAAVILGLSAVPGAAQEHVRYGTAVKFSPVYYLPVLAAQEQGIFKKHGLNVEWVPAKSGPDFIRDLAAGAVDIGSSTGATDIPAISRGAPAVIVGSLQPTDGFAIWVDTNSRFKTAKDLEGAKIGVSRLGGAEHAYGLLVAHELGLANDIRFVASGGVQESMALLQTGGIDGVVLTPHQMIELELQGKVRPLLQIDDYKQKPWVAYTITASKAFVAQHPEAARKVVASILEADRFIMSDAGRAWTIAKMKQESHYSDEAAARIYKGLALNTDGRIDPKAVQNVVDFMVRYKLLKPEDEKTAAHTYT
ncbi:MAG: ABC transporter substrate-binding protein, partial [Stellaceae bacterium]